MIKKLITVIMITTIACSLVACGGQNAKNSDSENGTSATQTDSKTKSSKKKYKNINADTNPIGIDNLALKMKDRYPYIFCTVHKNGGDTEESVVEVTLEILDENNTFVGEKTLKTKRSLTTGDTETVSDDLILEVSKENYNDDALSKYSVNVAAIKETDVAKAKETEELEKLMSEIEWKIKYDKEYNSALIMLEKAKEQYPDSQELKLFEAEMKDELAKQGIDMDGNKTETTEKSDTTK